MVPEQMDRMRSRAVRISIFRATTRHAVAKGRAFPIGLPVSPMEIPGPIPRVPNRVRARVRQERYASNTISPTGYHARDWPIRVMAKYELATANYT